MRKMPPYFRGTDMIVWKEQKPDTSIKPIAELANSFDLLDIALLLSASRSRAIVIIQSGCLLAVSQHLESSGSELGGLLLGRTYSLDPVSAQEKPAVISITGNLPSLHFDSTHVSLVMGTEVWNRARQAILEGFLVVGWYHSHPNLGAFFSGTDRVTQQRFFPHPYSVGLVVDPIQGQRRWFLGPGSEELSRVGVYES
jgi:hypothetical protein